jgi:hypothetical protein
MAFLVTWIQTEPMLWSLRWIDRKMDTPRRQVNPETTPVRGTSGDTDHYHNGATEDPFMADERNPDDRFRFSMTDDGIRRQTTRLDDELQADPELAEGPAGSGKVAMYAVAIAVLVGAVFYGLNNTSIDRAGTSSTAQNAAPPQNTAQTSPAAPQGMRDGTPGVKTTPNAAPGVTTGAAPAQPQTPPSSMPTGQDINRSGNPAANNVPSK